MPLPAFSAGTGTDPKRNFSRMILLKMAAVRNSDCRQTFFDVLRS
jgi:hypothetical protein